MKSLTSISSSSKSTVMINQGSDDHTPQMHPDAYKQGETKRRRMRKKVNSESVWRKRNLSLEQVNLLELSFGSERKLDSERKERIAADLGLGPRQVAVWFQNRRARWKTKKLQEEFHKLKSVHGDALLHKSHLESQVLDLKEQLAEAEREIGRLSIAGHSRSSSHSVDVSSVQEEQFYGNGFGFGFGFGFGMEGFDDLFYRI